jgi:hypothetical protein
MLAFANSNALVLVDSNLSKYIKFFPIEVVERLL